MKSKSFYSTIVVFLLAIFPFLGIAQQTKLEPLPIDTKVRYGKLDNSLTYFIRHNEQPKERASFYIAQAVGSILEKDSQWGLAHFLEHMAFSGTKNFPNKTLINYLETIGVKFGENLNAYTGLDETVYNISNVPTLREGIIDTCILILHDWSGFISLKEDAIDAERKIIHEEWRTRNDARNRVWQETVELTFPGSQYAKRFPIGSMDVIDYFKYNELRDYYHQWYRPDLQAIIIVGNIDVDQVEAKIKKIFADIPKPVNPSERIYYPVPDNKEPIVAIVTDKEANSSSVSIAFKHDVISVEQSRTMLKLQQNYIRQVFRVMANSRFSEIVQQANPPFVRAQAYDNIFSIAQTKDALTFSAATKEGGVKTGYVALLEEAERIKQYGFTESEYERAKIAVLKFYENAYNERAKENNDDYCMEYTKYFTTGGAIPGIEMEYAFVQQTSKTTTIKQINDYIKGLIGKENVVISINGPEKEGVTYPSAEEVRNLFNEISDKTLEPYKDNVSDEPLISKLPMSGKIVKEVKNEKLGVTELHLSNGTKVLLKPTDFKQDEIIMTAVRPGGISQLPQSEFASLKVINEIAGIGGLGNFDATNLRKILTGKTASVSLSLSAIEDNGSGAATVADFETMMQLLYLNFTALRKDTTAFASYLNRKKVALQNAEISPMTAFNDSMTYAIYKDNPFFKRLKSSDLPNANYDKALSMFKSRFENAAGFTFILVGNIDIEKMKPMIEQYIGGLPGTKYNAPKIKADLSARKENFKNVFDKEMNTSKATVFDMYVAQFDFTPKNLITLNVLSQMLEIVYTQKVRTDEGGTYGVNVSGSISKDPRGETSLRVMFETSPDRSEYLNNIIHRELKAFTTATPNVESFNKVKEFMVKKHKEDLHDNTYWKNSLYNIYLLNLNMIDSYDKVMNDMKAEDINHFAKEFLSKSHCIEVIMNGHEKK